MHFFRIHPSYWRDRLERAAAMGINTVEVYTPWQLHEPDPGHYVWSGLADVERWLEMVQEMGMKVLLRPGPYICAEWDNGGFPHWFASSKVAGGRSMRTRTRDPAYLDHVERWFSTLFARLRRFMLENGGPILMVQIENEYGFCGDDKSYLRSLASIVRTHLSDRVLLFTTDPPGVAPRGTLAGEEVYTVVDFGPGGWGW
jgi:beta-galactosidase